MTITQLKYFLAVENFQSFSKASKHLFVSQPTISISIKELEKEFGVALFERSNNQLTLTNEGRYFKNLATSLVAEYDQTISKFQKYIRKSEKIVVGIPPMLGTFLFPPIFENFYSLYPKVQMEIKGQGSIGNLEAVENKDVDLAIVVVNPEQQISQNLEYIVIGETNLVFAVKNEHQLAKKETISIDEINDTPLILMNEDTLQSKIVDEVFKKYEINPNIKIRTNQLITIKELISNGNYGAFLFNQVVENDSNIKSIQLKEPIRLNIILVWNKNSTLPNAANNFIEFIKSTMQ